jgi:hypothetical protein
MSTETTVQNLKINKLTKAQYDTITPSATEAYELTDLSSILDTIPSVDSALSTTSENPLQNKVITSALNDKADDNTVVKKDGGSSQQTISLSSGTGTTALGVKSRATSSSYISFTSSSAWLGSIGVNSNKQPVFYNGTGYTLATTSDIPTIATSVSSSSTNAEVVGAKLFYDTVGDIETLLQGV